MKKADCYWKHNFCRLCIRNPPECSKLAKNPKNNNDITVFRNDVNVKFFLRCLFSLVKFSYWSKFHVNIIPGSGIMTIFFYKGLIRNLEIGNNPIWVLPNIWRLLRVVDTKFGANVSNRMLLNAAKFQGYSFYHLWVIKGKPTGGKLPPPLTQIRVKQASNAHKINKIIHSKSKEETSRSNAEHDWGSLMLKLSESEQIIAGNCAMLMESKPWTIYWIR